MVKQTNKLRAQLREQLVIIEPSVQLVKVADHIFMFLWKSSKTLRIT